MASGCVRVDSTKKKSKKFGGASGLASLSVTAGLVFVTFFSRLGQQRELRYRDLRDTRSPNPLSFLLPQHGNVPNGRRQFLPSALARGRSPVDDETKPELPLREASSSRSIDLDLDHELMGLLSPEHSHGTSLSSLTASPVTNSRSSRPNYTGTFQCHSTSERANFRDRSSGGSGRGSRSSGCLAVVGVSLFALLVLCGAKKHRTAAVFRVLRSRVTSLRASRPPARLVRWGPSCCRPQVAAVPLRSFAPRARRLSCGAQEKKVGLLT